MIYFYYFSSSAHYSDYENFFKKIFALRIAFENVKNICDEYCVYFVADDYFADFAVFRGGMDEANGRCLGNYWDYNVYSPCGWDYYDSGFYFRNEKFI